MQIFDPSMRLSTGTASGARGMFLERASLIAQGTSSGSALCHFSLPKSRALQFFVHIGDVAEVVMSLEGGAERADQDPERRDQLTERDVVVCADRSIDR